MNNRSSLGLELSPQYILDDVEAPEIPEESHSHLKLRQNKQLQGVHKIELTVKGEEMEIGAKTVEGEVHNAVEGEMRVEAGTMLEIHPMRMRLGA